MNSTQNPRYHVVAGVVVAGGRCLAVQKGVTRFAYTTRRWEFPGGKIEPGETPQQALRRELIEEMSLDVEVGRHITTVTHRYPDFSITLEAYLCTADNPHFSLKEHIAYQWVEPSELDNLDWCGADVPIAREVTKLLTADCRLKK